jgi:hypothetical protein
MPEIACPSCGTSYDTAGFEPGQRFRCHGDACTERLTVPDPSAPAAPAHTETPTPAPIAAAPAAAAPVSNYADDEDVLEAKAPAGGKKRRRKGGSRRAAAPPPPADDRGERRRGNVQKPPSQAPMYAAIGGVGLILVIFGIVMLSAPVEPKGGKKAIPKPRFKKSDPVDFKSKGGGDTDEETEVPVEAPKEETKKPTRKPRKPKDSWRFVEDSGFKPTFEKHLKQMYHDDPNIASEAEDALFEAGSKEQLCNTILNHLPTMNFADLEDRMVASKLMNIVGDALGDEAREKVGDVAVVNPSMNAKIGYTDAMRAWRDYWKNNGGKVAGGN